jgi:ABC-type dipeptide/oligopeptide/nickel transport system permease component
LRRLLVTLPIVLAVIVITFTLGFYGPGDPLRAYYGENYDQLDPAAVERLREQYGLNRPYWEQLGDYMGGIVRGDFGESILLNRPVWDVMVKSLPVSLQLAAGAFVLIIMLGIPLGILTALRHNSWVDHSVLFTTIMLSTIPPFVLAPLLMILFILKLDILPSTVGWDGLFSVKVILPLVALTVGPLVGIIRYTRFSVLEALTQEYVRTARAKGLGTRQVMLRHVLPNALTPVVTALGGTVAGLITGSIFLETIFAIPGFGGQTVRALSGSDYPLILGTTMVGTLIVVLTNLVTDIMYGVLDPRVRISG